MLHYYFYVDEPKRVLKADTHDLVLNLTFQAQIILKDIFLNLKFLTVDTSRNVHFKYVDIYYYSLTRLMRKNIAQNWNK